MLISTKSFFLLDLGKQGGHNPFWLCNKTYVCERIEGFSSKHKRKWA